MAPKDTDSDQPQGPEEKPAVQEPDTGEQGGATAATADDSEILSDEENEALRESHGPAGPGAEEDIVPEGSIRELHADHWERIVAGRIPALESINERMVTLLATTTRKFLRRPADVTVHPTVMKKWGPYASKLTIPTNLNVLEIKPLNVRGAIRLDSDFVFTLVDLFFGGDGTGSHVLHQVEFTPMEVQLARNYAALIAADLKDAWQPFIDLEFELGSSESNPMFASVLKSSEGIAITSFTVQLGECERHLDIMLPEVLLEPIRFLSDAGQADGAELDEHRWQKQLSEDVKDASISLRAVLTETEISLGELTRARPGDVITTDIPANVTIFVGDQPVLEGTFGVMKGRNAVQINNRLNQKSLGAKDGRIQPH